MALLLPLDMILALTYVLALAISGCHAGLRTTFSGNKLPDIVPGQPGVDYPVASRVPVTQFRCQLQDYPGFFADPETGCQVFHVCRDNKQTSFLCPNGTLYHQRFFVCDWWFNVDCSKSVDLYPLNKDYAQRQIQDRRMETQAATLPTPTPSFARFEKRSTSSFVPSFQEWASRHIPLTAPTESASFKSTRMSEFSRFRDAPVPFSDSPFRSFSSSSSIWPKESTRPVAAATTTTVRSVSKPKDGDEYPLSEFAPQNIPVDKWFLLAKDPDFLNNIAWSAQLYINNKTKGAGYLRSKQNKKPTDQELEFHPFQGFNQQGVPTKAQETTRSERARPSFKPSPLLSLTKENAGTVWTPSSFLSSTTPRPFPTNTAPPVPQRPAPPQQFTPPPPKPTPVPKQTQPFKQQATRPWTQQKQQTKKQQYQAAASYSGPAYQVTLTSASDYQVILTRPPPPTASQKAPKTFPKTAGSPPKIQKPRVISPSLLPLESHPLTNQTPAKYLRPPTRAPKSTSNNQRSQTPPVTSSTQAPVQQPQQQQPQQQPPQQAQASEQALQFSRTDGQQLFRTTEAERITSKSVPIRPSLLLSTGVPSRPNPYEFEPANQKWTVEPITASGNKNSVSTDGGQNSQRATGPRINNYVETDVILGRLIPTSTAQLDPFQHNGEPFSSVNDRNMQSFVVRPRSPLTLASSL